MVKKNDSESLTLSAALKAGRLDDFVAQAEAEGVGPISRGSFDQLIDAATAPQPEDQTSHSRDDDGSRGK